MRTRVLISGASGFLGANVLARLHPSHRTMGLCWTRSREQLVGVDIGDHDALAEVFRHFQPDWVVHTAAISNPDTCETDPRLAFRTNVIGTRNIAQLSAAHGATLVHISTDYVFDGASPPHGTTAIPKPVNYYGVTKLVAEEAARLVGNGRLAVIRIPVLYGFTSKDDRQTFPTQVIRCVRTGQPIVVDHHATRYPTLIDDVSETIAYLIANWRPGLYHLTGPDGVTKAQWVHRILDVLGVPESTVKLQLADEPSRATRPANSQLALSLPEGCPVSPTPLKQGLEQLKALIG